MEFERPGDVELSLRERKKLQSKRRIQGAAFGLLETHAYDGLTVEEIAAAAEVSPSTVYRHFQTKEGIFLWDEYDDAVLDEFESLLEDHEPIDAMIKALDQVLTSQFDAGDAMAQLQLLDAIEPLRYAMVGRMDDLRKDLAAMVTESGWQPLRASVFAGAVVSSFQGVLELWLATNGRQSLPAMFDHAMRLLAAGFDSSADRDART